MEKKLSRDEKAYVKVISDNHHLIASVHFLTFGDESTHNDIFLKYKDSGLVIAIQFVDVPDKEPFMAINDAHADEKIIGLTFINFSQNAGVWNRTAYNIGKIAGEPLYLRAKVLASPGPSKHREILLSFYVECSQ